MFSYVDLVVKMRRGVPPRPLRPSCCLILKMLVNRGCNVIEEMVKKKKKRFVCTTFTHQHEGGASWLLSAAV